MTEELCQLKSLSKVSTSDAKRSNTSAQDCTAYSFVYTLMSLNLNCNMYLLTVKKKKKKEQIYRLINTLLVVINSYYSAVQNWTAFFPNTEVHKKKYKLVPGEFQILRYGC